MVAVTAARSVAVVEVVLMLVVVLECGCVCNCGGGGEGNEVAGRAKEEEVVVVEEEGLWNGREPRLGIERAVLGDEGVGRYAY